MTGPNLKELVHEASLCGGVLAIVYNNMLSMIQSFLAEIIIKRQIFLVLTANIVN